MSESGDAGYPEFYGFSENPFNGTPDLRFLFLTRSHQECLDSIFSGIQEREGLISLLGEAGTGKTFLIHSLTKRLEKDFRTVFISSYPGISFTDLLRKTDQGCPPAEKESLAHNGKRGENWHPGHIVVFLDEAQSVNREFLERLQELPELDGNSLQIIFVGHPEFDAAIESESLRRIREKIRIRRRIGALSRRESEEYIEHHLNLVGSSSSEVFTPQSLGLICRHGKGIPQSINTICENVLWIGYRRSQRRIDIPIVRDALDQMHASERILFYKEAFANFSSGLKARLGPEWKAYLRKLGSVPGFVKGRRWAFGGMVPDAGPAWAWVCRAGRSSVDLAAKWRQSRVFPALAEGLGKFTRGADWRLALMHFPQRIFSILFPRLRRFPRLAAGTVRERWAGFRERLGLVRAFFVSWPSLAGRLGMKCRSGWQHLSHLRPAWEGREGFRERLAPVRAFFASWPSLAGRLGMKCRSGWQHLSHLRPAWEGREGFRERLAPVRAFFASWPSLAGRLGMKCRSGWQHLSHLLPAWEGREGFQERLAPVRAFFASWPSLAGRLGMKCRSGWQHLSHLLPAWEGREGFRERLAPVRAFFASWPSLAGRLGMKCRSGWQHLSHLLPAWEGREGFRERLAPVRAFFASWPSLAGRLGMKWRVGWQQQFSHLRPALGAAEQKARRALPVLEKSIRSLRPRPGMARKISYAAAPAAAFLFFIALFLSREYPQNFFAKVELPSLLPEQVNSSKELSPPVPAVKNGPQPRVLKRPALPPKKRASEGSTEKGKEAKKISPPSAEKKISTPPAHPPVLAADRKEPRRSMERLPVIKKAALISIEKTVPARPAEKPGFVSARTGPISPAGLPAGKMKMNESKEPEPATLAQRIPVIHSAFAAREISPGETWKIYLEASAMNGDMKNIFSIIERGNSFPSITRIHEKNRKHLAGYLFLKTMNTADPFANSNLTLRVWIQDAAGHFSEPVVFPLRFQSPSRPEEPPPGLFAEENLGPIMVQLVPFGVEGG